MGRFTEKPSLPNAKKYVASKTSLKLDWNNSTLIAGDVVQEFQKLKKQDGPDLQVHGSGNLIQTLLKRIPDLAELLTVLRCILRRRIEQVIAHFKTWRIMHTDYRRPIETCATTI